MKNGHFKLQIPSQVCCCVCLVWKAAILLNSTIKSQTQESLLQMLLESNRLFSQVLKDLQEKEERLRQKARKIKNATIEAKQVAAQLQLMAGQLGRLASHILAEAKK